MTMAQNHTPGITIKGETADPDYGFQQPINVNFSYTSSNGGQPKVSTISVVGEAYPKHGLIFDPASGHVRVVGDGNVPYMHHLALCNKLTETINQK